MNSNWYLKNLNEDQKEAVLHKDGPLLIIAGAGSGKTHTLTHRVMHLINEGTPPEKILLLTFTNKAAKEMKERVSLALGNRAERIQAGTFHSFCANMLRKFAKFTDYTHDFTIISPPESAEAIGLARAAEGERFAKLKDFPSDKVLKDIFSYAVNKETGIREALQTDKWSKYKQYTSEAEALQNAYAVFRLENDMMDYDDLLINFLRLLERNESVRAYIESIFDHILVDEYQDTNSIQDKILFLLRKNNRNITVVGDDAQSIYAFRGAEVDNIITFPERIGGCRIVSIRTNYRSTCEIVNFSNELFNNNTTTGFPKEMKGTYTVHDPVHIEGYEDIYGEAERAYAMIDKWVSEGTSPSEIAVLARNARHMSQLETLLAKEGIEYIKYGGLKFLEHACVVDILSFLRCITNQNAQLSWFRVLKLLPGIGNVYAGRISENCGDRNFLLNPAYRKRSYAEALIKLHKNIERWRMEEDYEKAFKDIVNTYIDMRIDHITQKPRTEEKRSEMADAIAYDKEVLNSLEEIAMRYDDMVRFLDDITLDAAEPEEDKKDPIILSTIHSAKGLEFECVIILGCTDGRFPMKEAEWLSTEEEENEELRCMYVAATRAKKHLYILWPAGFGGFGDWKSGNLSRFVRKVIHKE